jgi:hypothetical protein
LMETICRVVFFEDPELLVHKLFPHALLLLCTISPQTFMPQIRPILCSLSLYSM